MNTRGQSLLSVLVASALMGILFSVLLNMQLFGFKASSHTQLKGDVSNLQNTLHQQIDCVQTFTGVNVATDCTNSGSWTPAPVPILLKDKAGNPITAPLASVSGTFDPNDTT